MENFQPQCKLCGGTVRDDNFRGIDDNIKRIFNVLLLTLSSDKDIQYVLCEVCSSKLFAAFNFKSTCLHMDSSIKLYVDSGNPAPVDLKKIYAKQKGKKQGEICRLCFQPMVKSEEKSIQEVPLDSIQIYIPEINFAQTSESAICLNCFDSLHVHSTFVKNCLDMVEKQNIKLTLNNPCVKTENIEIKFEEAKEGEMPVEIHNSDVKKEEVEECNSCIRGEEVEIEEEEVSVGDQITEIQKEDKDYNSLIKTEEFEIKCVAIDKMDVGIDNIKIEKEETDDSKSCIKIQEIQIKPEEIEEGTHYYMEINKETEEVKSCVRIESEIKYDESDEDEQPVESQYMDIKNEENEEGDLSSCSRNNLLRKYKCSECDYKSVQKAHLRMHQLRHKDPSEVPMFKCDECDYKTMRKGDMKKHLLRHKNPSEVRVFECDECDYKSIRKGNLLTHQLRHKDPSEVRMYECSECDFKSMHKVQLRMHQLRHKDPSEVPMFKCEECDYKSIRKGTVLAHQLIHKDPSKVQMFKCSECDFKSKQKVRLRLHQSKHKDPSEVPMFKCDECDYKSIRKDYLKRHQLRHKDPSEVPMFECDQCDYRNIHKYPMKRHQLIHKDPSEVSMFKCDECDYKSIRKSDIKRHLLRHKDPSEGQMFRDANVQNHPKVTSQDTSG